MNNSNVSGSIVDIMKSVTAKTTKEFNKAKKVRARVYNIDKEGVLRVLSKGKPFLDIGIRDIAVKLAVVYCAHFIAIRNNAGEFRVLKDITGEFNFNAVYIEKSNE